MVPEVLLVPKIFTFKEIYDWFKRWNKWTIAIKIQSCKNTHTSGRGRRYSKSRHATVSSWHGGKRWKVEELNDVTQQVNFMFFAYNSLSSCLRLYRMHPLNHSINSFLQIIECDTSMWMYIIFIKTLFIREKRVKRKHSWAVKESS